MCAVMPYTPVMLCSRAGLRDYDYGTVRVRPPLLRQICSHIPYNIDRAWVWGLGFIYFLEERISYHAVLVSSKLAILLLQSAKC